MARRPRRSEPGRGGGQSGQRSRSLTAVSSSAGVRTPPPTRPALSPDDADEPQAAIPDDAGAEQRRRGHGGHAGRETVDEPGRRHRVLGEAAVHVPAGEQRVVAQVLVPALAEPAALVGLVQPRHADPVAHGERRRLLVAAGVDAVGTRPEGGHLADDLVAGHHGRAVRRQLALQDVQVGAAHATGQHPQQHLAGSRLGHRQFDELERRLLHGRRRRQLHRLHVATTRVVTAVTPTIINRPRARMSSPQRPTRL